MADPFSAIIAAAQFVFSSTNIVAQAVRFVGSALITSALSGSKQPKLSDLKIQTSAYGAPIPRLYGQAVRVAGNVIDKTDLIPIKHKKGGFLGTDIGGVKYYTYDADIAVLIAEGEFDPGALVRIFANGKVIFDRDAEGATPGVATPEGGVKWSKLNKTQSKIAFITFYPGSATQGVDPKLQSMHPGQTLSAYRYSAYVMLERVQVSDLGGSIPNLEFEIEPRLARLDLIVKDLAGYADCKVATSRLLETPVRGYVVAQDGSVWDAISPLAAAYSFDFVAQGPGFFAAKRGHYMRTVIPQKDWAARPVGQAVDTTKEVKAEDPNKYPDEVTVTYLDPERDFQPNTQRAFRNAGYSRNKINTELPLVLTADEARGMAQLALDESIAKTRTINISVSDKYRWLDAGSIVGLTINDQVEPFVFQTMTKSPNGAIEVEAYHLDPLAYQQNLQGAVGNFPTGVLELPGETIMQPIDGPIIANIHDDPGFYAAFAGMGPGWTGAEVSAANGSGSPLTFEIIGNIGLGALMGDADTTLPAGPTDVWDETSTLTVTPIGIDADAAFASATAEEVETLNANLAWLGNVDGHDGEVLNFRDVTPTSPPGSFILSGFLRGRKGTERLVGTHGPGERLVMLNDIDSVYRITLGAVDWNVTRTYRSVSLPDDDQTDVAFINTGRGKRPYAPVHLLGTRNDVNNDVAISWVRRTRLAVPAIGGGAVPLGEDVEAYEIDILHPVTPALVVRTLTSATPAVTYTSAMQTADGYTPGALIKCNVYQMSGIFGRGDVAEGIL